MLEFGVYLQVRLIVCVSISACTLRAALGTNAVCERGLRMVGNVGLELVPITLIVADLFASGADGEQAAEGLHVRQSAGKVLDQIKAFIFLLTLDGDVALDRGNADDAVLAVFDRRACQRNWNRLASLRKRMLSRRSTVLPARIRR